MRIYNSLNKRVEDFKPVDPSLITMYTCGPTVYMYPHIGNWRTYTLSDFVYRALRLNGYQIRFVMNLTDVGHLSGDNEGDADTGNDRLEKQADKEGKSARAIADFYIEDFLKGFDKLNLEKPSKFTRATDYINEQIDLVKRLEEKGCAYKISDGIYFDTSRFDDYGKLSGLSPGNVLEGSSVEPNPEKKSPTDFALWKFSPREQKRWQEWQSPWGIGFPGWHLECSAMALKELGETIDLHFGGEDLRMIHHQNEIAQSESVTGKKFVKYWVHAAFLLVDGGKMGKSLGNVFTISDIEERGFEPLALRYLYTTAHYRAKLNFTWESLSNAQASLRKIYDIVAGYKESRAAKVSDKYYAGFKDAINNDINVPEAVSIMWEMLKSNLGEPEKLATILEMDDFLGLRIEDYVGFEIPQKVQDLARTRQEYRKAGIWDKADVIRREISEMGYVVEDILGGAYKLKRRI